MNLNRIARMVKKIQQECRAAEQFHRELSWSSEDRDGAEDSWALHEINVTRQKCRSINQRIRNRIRSHK